MPLLAVVPDHPYIRKHSLDDATSSIPAVVQHIVSLYTEPLPQGIAERIDSVQSTSSLEGRDTSFSGIGMQLLHILDGLLWIVRETRSLGIHASSPFGAANSILTLFVDLVASQFATKLVVQDNVRYALRKYPAELSCFSGFHPLYASAACIAVLPLPGTEHPVFTEPCVMATRSVHPSASSSPMDDVDSPMDDVDASYTSFDYLSDWLRRAPGVRIPPPSYATLSVAPLPLARSLQRHLYTANVSTPSIAVLALATQDAIYDVLSSILYQRLAWRIRTPVLGLSYIAHTSSVQTIVAWLDDDVTQDGQLPEMHVLHAPLSMDGGPANGIFSLTDPMAALCLAQLLLSLEPLIIPDLSAAQPVQDDELVCWRADQECEPPENCWKDVSAWVRNTDQYRCEMVDPLHPDNRLYSPEQWSARSPTDICERKLHMFLAMREKTNRHPTAVAAWLLDRFAVYDVLPPKAMLHDNIESLSEAVSREYVALFTHYHLATQYYWPCQWRTSACVPQVPPRHNTARERLILASASASSMILDSARDPDDVVSAALNRHLGIILEMAALAKNSMDNPLLNFSTRRALWDALSWLDVPATAAFSVHQSGDTVLRLPRNDYMDTLPHHAYARKAWLSAWNSYSEHTIDFDSVRALFDRDGDADLISKIIAAEDRFISDCSLWRSETEDTQLRAMHGPLTAHCDNFIALAIRDHPLSSAISKRCLIAGFRDSGDRYVHGETDWDPDDVDPWTQLACDTFDMIRTCHHDYPDHMAPSENMRSTHVDVATQETKTRQESASNRSAHQDPPWCSFPLLVTVYGTKHEPFKIADSNRLRVCLVAAVKYLAFMGIFDFPVFGLLTEGTVGVVVMSWADKGTDGAQDKVHILELNCRAYDISTPTGALNYSTFVLWVRTQHAARLAALLMEPERMELMRRKLQDDDPKSGWTAEEQRIVLESDDPSFWERDENRR